MKWQNAARDFLPATSRSVLISDNGVYQVAFYDREKREFHVADGDNKVVIHPLENVYWTDIDVVVLQKKKHCTILIVDDEVDDQHMLKRELLHCLPELQVDSVFDGEEAMAYLLRKGKFQNIKKLPDLILLDLNLPLMDGFEVMEKMQKDPELKKIPVFVISTSRSLDQWNRALDLGARCFFNKGSSAADVRRVAHEICLSL